MWLQTGADSGSHAPVTTTYRNPWTMFNGMASVYAGLCLFSFLINFKLERDQILEYTLPVYKIVLTFTSYSGPRLFQIRPCIYCLTSRRQALLGRKFQLHASLAACAWVGRLRGDRDYIRIKTFTRPDECILNAKMNWIEMWRARACGREVAAFDEWNNFREANLSRQK